MTTIIRYKVELLTKNNEPVIISLLLSDNIKANVILGWANMTKYEIDMLVSSKRAVSAPLHVELGIKCREPDTPKPPANALVTTAQQGTKMYPISQMATETSSKSINSAAKREEGPGLQV